ncbi:MAG: hypothetical protein JWP87_3834, partial [Labilithrix sp.]|nr:hypothetical protein [Labilithrix sp.]
MPRVTDESRDPEAIGAAGEGESTDKLSTPPPPDADCTSSPSTPESVHTETSDRGRTIALGTLAGLIVLGLVLIARGPQASAAQARSASTSPAVLTGAELAPS